MSEKMTEDKVIISKGKGLEWFQLKNLRDNTLIATKWGDLLAILDGGSRMYDVRYETLKKSGFEHKEAHNEALMSVIRGIEKTQQSGAIHNLSRLQRSGSYGKLITLFQNTPLQYLRIEMAALTSLKQEVINASKGNADLSKLANSAKTFMVYHFVLPQLFRAASSGFYLGSDKSFLDDPDLFLSMIMGSMAYAPIAGSGAMSLLSHMNKGYSFGISQNILSDMLEDTDGLLELASDMIMKSNDPIGLDIDIEIIKNSINSVSQWAGVPTAAPLTWGKGTYDYLTGRTDNWVSLLGYPKSVYQGTLLSDRIGEINMNLPENGGNLNSYLNHMRENLGPGKYEKQESHLIREYRIYEAYGLDNSHVNFLYKGTDNSHEQAMYLMGMFKSEVEGRMSLRPNYTLRQLRNDIKGNVNYSYPEFMSLLNSYLANGVITEKTYDDFILQLQMPEDEFIEIFDFL
jgi:hypothetical protein